jgi:hypothetical protein
VAINPFFRGRFADQADDYGPLHGSGFGLFIDATLIKVPD